MDYTVHGILCQDTGVGSLSLLQGIFPTQGSNLGLPHCRRILYQLSHKGLTESQNFIMMKHLIRLVNKQMILLSISSGWDVWIWVINILTLETQ